jgi:hypothetical protein
VIKICKEFEVGNPNRSATNFLKRHEVSVGHAAACRYMCANFSDFAIFGDLSLPLFWELFFMKLRGKQKSNV